MLGTICNLLLGFVEEKAGSDAVFSVRERAGAGPDDYRNDSTYSDNEWRRLVDAVADVTGLSMADAVSSGDLDPAASEEALPVFDRHDMLRRFEGSRDLALKVVKIFRRDTPGRPDLVISNLETGDVEGVWKSAHALKGAAANVGGERLRRLSLAIELASRDGRVGDVECLSDQLRAAGRELLDEIDSYIAENGNSVD